MLDVAVVNSLIIYNRVSMNQDRESVTENDYRDALVLQLINKYYATAPTLDQQSPTPCILPPNKCRNIITTAS